MRYYNEIQIINNQTYTTSAYITIPDVDGADYAEFIIQVNAVVGSPTAIDVVLQPGFAVGGSIVYGAGYTVWTFSGVGTFTSNYRGAIKHLRFSVTPLSGVTSYTLSISMRVRGT